MEYDYTPLRVKMAEQNILWKDLRNKLEISTVVTAKIKKNEMVSSNVLLRLCQFFHCQLTDIVLISYKN